MSLKVIYQNAQFNLWPAITTRPETSGTYGKNRESKTSFQGNETLFLAVVRNWDDGGTFHQVCLSFNFWLYSLNISSASDLTLIPSPIPDFLSPFDRRREDTIP